MSASRPPAVRVLRRPGDQRDARFADNPLFVGEPHIRFYAGCPLRALNGHKLGTLCIIDRKAHSLDSEDLAALQDLAGMVEREIAAIQLATLDELTGNSNRRGFMTLGRCSLDFCARQRMPAALLFVDLDRSKPINDTFGHVEGDRALCAFAEQLRSNYRNSDVFARLGGDEFAALRANSNRTQAEVTLERLAGALERYNREAARGYDTAFSHGIVEFDPAQPCPIQEMLVQGDALMYDIKSRKR